MIRRLAPVLLALPIVALVLLMIGGDPLPVEILVLSSNAARSVVETLEPEFEQAARHTLVVSYAPSAELKVRIERGERFDVAILSSALVDELAARRLVNPQVRAAVGRVGAGVAIRKGAPRPDISTAEALRRTLLDAASIAYAGQGVTAGIVEKAAGRLGIAGEVRAKTTLLAGVTATAAVASGQAELGFTQISEILPHPGVELLGPLPPDLQVYTTFEAVLGTRVGDPGAARDFVRFLTAPAAAPVIRAKGLEPR